MLALTAQLQIQVELRGRQQWCWLRDMPRARNASGDVFPDGSPCLGARTTLSTSGDMPEGTDMPFGMSGASFGRVDVSQGQ